MKEDKQCFVTESRRDFVYVKDLAKVVLKACDGVGSGAYHFSTGTDVSILELYDTVVEAMQLKEYPMPTVKALEADDVFSILLDPSRLHEDFGHLEFASITDTVGDAVKYYQEFGTLGEYTHLRLNPTSNE